MSFGVAIFWMRCIVYTAIYSCNTIYVTVQELRLPCNTPATEWRHAVGREPAYAQGYSMSPLRGWFSLGFIQSHKRILIHCAKSATSKSVSEGQSTLTRSLAHASGYQKPMPDVKAQSKTDLPCVQPYGSSIKGQTFGITTIATAKTIIESGNPNFR